LPSNTVTSTDLHLGGGGGTVANKHSGGGVGGGHRNTLSICGIGGFCTFTVDFVDFDF